MKKILVSLLLISIFSCNDGNDQKPAGEKESNQEQQEYQIRLSNIILEF
jgi:hypothetical protein